LHQEGLGLLIEFHSLQGFFQGQDGLPKILLFDGVGGAHGVHTALTAQVLSNILHTVLVLYLLDLYQKTCLEHEILTVTQLGGLDFRHVYIK